MSTATSSGTQETISLREGMFQTRVFQLGTGDPVVYLPDILPPRDWAQEPLVAKLAERHRVIVPEHLGYGESEGIDHIKDIFDLTIYYLDLLDALGIERFDLVGASFGGLIAPEIAVWAPQRVRRLVLIDPFGIWLDEHPAADRFGVSHAEVPPLLFADPQGEAAQSYLALPADRAARGPVLFERAKADAAAAKLLWPIPDRGLRRRVHRLKTPTLILWGEQDRIMPPVYGEALRDKIAGARLQTIPNAGHLAALEQPEAVTKAVLEFLGEK